MVGRLKPVFGRAFYFGRLIPSHTCLKFTKGVNGYRPAQARTALFALKYFSMDLMLLQELGVRMASGFPNL